MSCTFSSPYLTANPAVAYGFGGSLASSASFGLLGQFYDSRGSVCADSASTIVPILFNGGTNIACSNVSSVSVTGYTLLCNLPQTAITTTTPLSIYQYDPTNGYSRYAPFYVPVTPVPNPYTGNPTVTSTVYSGVTTVTGRATPGATEITTIYNATTATATATVTAPPTTTTQISVAPCSGAVQNHMVNSSSIIPASAGFSSVSAPDVGCSVYAYTASPTHYGTNISISLGGTGKPILPLPTFRAFLTPLPGQSNRVVTRTTTISVQRTTCPANCPTPPPTLARRIDGAPVNGSYVFVTATYGTDSRLTTK